jgi:hypothetical protein
LDAKRLDQLHAAEHQRDQAVIQAQVAQDKAHIFESDWVSAKYEFGTRLRQMHDEHRAMEKHIQALENFSGFPEATHLLFELIHSLRDMGPYVSATLAPGNTPTSKENPLMAEVHKGRASSSYSIVERWTKLAQLLSQHTAPVSASPTTFRSAETPE